MRRCLLLASCLLVTGCSLGSAPAARPTDTVDVYEAVFRYRLKDRAANLEAYLAIDGKDPPAELLTRLRRDWPNLKPVSEEPKEKGHRVYVENLKLIGQDKAEAHAGYWFPTKFAGQGNSADHHIVREGERWVVQKVSNEISS
jgi:hypothetical protein